MPHFLRTENSNTLIRFSPKRPPARSRVSQREVSADERSSYKSQRAAATDAHTHTLTHAVNSQGFTQQHAGDWTEVSRQLSYWWRRAEVIRPQSAVCFDDPVRLENKKDKRALLDRCICFWLSNLLTGTSTVHSVMHQKCQEVKVTFRNSEHDWPSFHLQTGSVTLPSKCQSKYEQFGFRKS